MKNKTKNLIYVFVLLVLMPAGRVIAAPRVTKAPKVEFNIVQNAKIAEVEVKVNKNVEIPKNIIDENKPKAPVSPVETTESYSYVIYTKEEIKAKICEVFGSECSNALIIAFKESGYRQFAVSKTNDYGVFQLNCRWQKRRVGGVCTRFFDVDTNIRVAKQIFDEQGWAPWSTKIYLPK